METTIIHCKNCETILQENHLFCSNCGQKVQHERFTLKKLLSELWRITTNVERGLFFTMKQMFLAPHTVISDYCNGKTKPYYHPFRYIFLMASISILIGFYLHIYDAQQDSFNDALGISQDAEQIARQQEINKYIKSYMNLIYLIIIPFMSYFTYRLFKKKGYNYAEHLVANAYGMGQMAFFGIFTMLLYLVIPSLLPFAMLIGIGTSSLYYGYIYKKLFKVSYLNATFKSLLSSILAYVGLMLIVTIITIIVVIAILIIKKTF